MNCWKLARAAREKTLRSAAAHIRQVLETIDWRVRGAGGTAEILDLKFTALVAVMAKLDIMKSAK